MIRAAEFQCVPALKGYMQLSLPDAGALATPLLPDGFFRRELTFEKVAQLSEPLREIERRAEHPVGVSEKLRQVTETLRAEHQA